MKVKSCLTYLLQFFEDMTMTIDMAHNRKAEYLSNGETFVSVDVQRGKCELAHKRLDVNVEVQQALRGQRVW